MKVMLSQSEIESFVGNVLPLRLLGVEEYGMEDIRWETSDPCVQITTFDQDKLAPFTDGVLLTLLSDGVATVTASHQAQNYRCQIHVRKKVHTDSHENLSWFVGNFHDHTARTHSPEEFPQRKEGLPRDYIKQLQEEGKLDFTVISDHADLLNGREFFRGFWDDYEMENGGLVVFPGNEAEVSPLLDDRYGVEHKVGGEIVVVNGDNFACTPNWEKFFDRYRTSPFAIGVLAHPQIVGISRKGVWNFELEKHRTPDFFRMIRGVEMGNGTQEGSNLINEYVYSVALDNGFRVSTTCSSDVHGPIWGARVFRGRTVIMAPEKTKEAFLDALESCRFYASGSGNVKLSYAVNGQAAPGTLAPGDAYRFRVRMELFDPEQGGMPVRLQVISDYGKTIWETQGIENEMEFTVKSQTARYFYLRLTDADGRKTWSVPIWTGREFDPQRQEAFTPLAKNGFTALEEVSGQDASVLLNDDPDQPLCCETPVCSILIDMQRPQKITALGHYPTMLDIKQIRAAGENQTDRIVQFPVRYQLETGLTPDNMTLQAEGLFRVFGAEELIRFPEHEARFVRLRILSNAGKESGWPQHQNHGISMAELTPYGK